MARNVRRFVRGRLDRDYYNNTRSGRTGVRWNDGIRSRFLNSNQCHCVTMDGSPYEMCENCNGTGILKRKR